LSQLILKRASASRPSGEWNEDDSSMVSIGAIFQAEPAGDHIALDHRNSILIFLPGRRV
jgi:hypothetical protein